MAFLSIVMRTQGKRPEALSEVLLCLMAQTDKDYEVLLLGHKLDERGKMNVLEVLDDIPETLRKKIKLIEVNEGNRTRPLNVGFEMAEGKYISILDDDDLVFDNWVEEFHNLDTDGEAILHSFSINQAWRSYENQVGKNKLAASGSPGKVYCKKFNLFKEFVTNTCPVMTLAFPKKKILELNMKFDESLSTVEDWDFLMRMATACAVKDVEIPTSIYRIWENAENSYNIHDQEEWRRNCSYVQEKINQMSVVLQPGTVAEYIAQQWEESEFAEAFLYVDAGQGMSEKTKLTAEQDSSGMYDIIFAGMSEWGNISSLRFDPCDRGMISMDRLKFTVIYSDGKHESYDIDTISSNGYRVKDEIAFCKNDPQLLLAIDPPRSIECVKIKYGLFDTTDSVVETYWYQEFERKQAHNRINQKIRRKISHYILRY